MDRGGAGDSDGVGGIGKGSYPCEADETESEQKKLERLSCKRRLLNLSEQRKLLVINISCQSGGY